MRHAAGALCGRSRCTTPVWRREFAADVALKKNGQYRYWPVKEEFHIFIIMPSL